MANERRSQGCFCRKYVDSISKIARLEEDVARLKRENAELRKQPGKARRTALEKPFGESPPSVCRLVKPSPPGTCRRCRADTARRRGAARPRGARVETARRAEGARRHARAGILPALRGNACRPAL